MVYALVLGTSFCRFESYFGYRKKAGIAQLARVPSFQVGSCEFESHYPLFLFDFVAQLVELFTFNEEVMGSSPIGITTYGSRGVRSISFRLGRRARRFESTSYNTKTIVFFLLNYYIYMYQIKIQKSIKI